MINWDDKELLVECYSGFKAHERPVVFIYQGERREIKDIADRWYEGNPDSSRPVIDYFKVRTTDGNVYFLRYRSDSDTWSLRI